MNNPNAPADPVASPASEALRAELTPEQWRLALQVLAEDAALRDEEQFIFVEELARHLPGLAPVLRLLGDHLLDQNPDQRGVCCVDVTR